MWRLPIGILLGVALLTLAGLWLRRALQGYALLFADGHLREVASRLPALKRAALERIIVPGADAACAPEDPRGMISSAGLAVLYVIGREGGWFHHDLSVSLPARRYAIHAVADLFVSLLVRLLGLGEDRPHHWVSPASVYHAQFRLSAREHEQFADEPVAPLSPAELAAFRRDWALSGTRVRWERVLEAHLGRRGL